MLEYIENSKIILGKIGKNNNFHFSDIVKIEFVIEENIFNEQRSILYLDLKTKIAETS